MSASAVDEYIAALPPHAQAAVGEVRDLIAATAPGVTERISYGMPTFDWNGRRLLCVAGWQKHIALYALTAGIESALGDAIGPYRSHKATLRFPLDRPLPLDILRRIVQARVAELG